MSNIFDANDQSAPGHYGPSQTALLLLDFHGLFVEKVAGPKGPAAAKAAAELRLWAKSRGVAIIHSLVECEGPVLPTAKSHAMFTSMTGMLKSTGKVDEPPELWEGGAAGNEISHPKPLGYISNLTTPEIKTFLETKGIKSLIICGLSTSGCVLRTSDHATDAGYIVTVIEDACADPKEEVHKVVIESILPTNCFICSAKEFQEGYGAK